MAMLPGWADLLPDLLCRIIGDHIADLRSYASARGVCTGWRSALAPPSPALLVLADDAAARYSFRPYAASLRARRSFELAAAAAASGSRCRCVGASGDGWLALSVDRGKKTAVSVSLFHPVAGAEIRLPPLVVDKTRHWGPLVSKVVLAPRPAGDDFAAAAICDADRVAYVVAGAEQWAVMEPLPLAGLDYLTDLLYAAAAADGGEVVYCLTQRGNVHVLRLPQRRRRNPPPPAHVVVDEEAAAASSKPEPPQLAAEFEGTIDPRKKSNEQVDEDPIMSHWTADTSTVPDLNIPLRDDQETKFILPDLNIRLTDADEAETFIVPSDNKVLLDESQGQDLNDPATIEPLFLSEPNLPFINPATTVFTPPYYDTVSSIAGAKNLVLCEGNLYQVWRNKSCTVILNLPAGGQRCRVVENEILVLRYYPQRQPYCWDLVKDLGGYSFFVGRNNAVSMYAKGVPGLRGNCVYWIGGSGRDQAMVFDMESGTSMPCSGFFLPGQPHSNVCWYFLGDVNEQQQQLQQ